jgi:CheY-like chemotaxis protein
MPETIETVALDPLVSRVLALTKPRAVEQGLSPGVKVSLVKQVDGNVEVQGDPARLRDMLVHLVRNSIHAIPRRGTVTVAARQQGTEVIITVQDDGLGITEAARQRLLDASEAGSRPDGSPTGYAVVHEVVARHRGRLEIESRKGIGTTVRVILPSAEETTAKRERRRILVVDDDPMVREVISTYLSEDGYTVELAANGREGLEKFCAGEFDIVLTDRPMPEMNGDQLALEVKKRRPDVPVLLLTGFGELMAASGEKPEGVDLVMSKPFTMAGLQNSLARFR